LIILAAETRPPATHDNHFFICFLKIDLLIILGVGYFFHDKLIASVILTGKGQLPPGKEKLWGFMN
jgi:hypothetical protein